MGAREIFILRHAIARHSAAACRGAPEPEPPPLALPALRPCHPLVREYSRAQLSGAARPVLRMQGVDQHPLSAGGIGLRRAVCLLCGAMGHHAHRRCLVPFQCGLAEPGIDRLGHHTASRRHHPALAVGRTAVVGAALDRRASGRRGMGRCSGLSLAVAGLLGLQAGHRQGRHGLRRLQAVCRAGRLVRLAGTRAHHPDLVGDWRHRGHRVEINSRLREGGYVPFGPFLAGAGFAAMVFGPQQMLQSLLAALGL